MKTRIGDARVVAVTARQRTSIWLSFLVTRSLRMRLVCFRNENSPLPAARLLFFRFSSCFFSASLSPRWKLRGKRPLCLFIKCFFFSRSAATTRESTDGLSDLRWNLLPDALGRRERKRGLTWFLFDFIWNQRLALLNWTGRRRLLQKTIRVWFYDTQRPVGRH